MQMCSLLRTIFYGFEMAPLTTLAANENLFQGYKIDLITHPKPCNGYSLSFVSPRFSTFYINIHEYANEIIFI